MRGTRRVYGGDPVLPRGVALVEDDTLCWEIPESSGVLDSERYGLRAETTLLARREACWPA